MLEIGCGATGVPGLVLGYCGLAIAVDFTDQDPACLRELSSNIKYNQLLQQNNGNDVLAQFNVLPACSYENIIQRGGVFEDGQHVRYDVIVGCELVFDFIDIDQLARCVLTLLSVHEGSRFILCQSSKGRGKVFEFIEAMKSRYDVSRNGINHNHPNGSAVTTIVKCFEKSEIEKEGENEFQSQWRYRWSDHPLSIYELNHLVESKDILMLSFELQSNTSTSSF